VRDLPGNGLPYRLTLAGKSRIPSIPNPLTSFPALAHRHSRSPSPHFPAAAHPGSRKASPDRPESPARQGLAVALTFLTGIKGVYFYISQARIPPRATQDIHIQSQPPGNVFDAARVKQRIAVKLSEKFARLQGLMKQSSICFTEKPPRSHLAAI